MIDLETGARVCLFVGAGMSAESGVPTYRGAGGIWAQYDFQRVACQAAFEHDPKAVLDFHELRRATVLACAPRAGHLHIAALQQRYPGQISVVTQNIDGLLQRAGVTVDAELHGSLWRMRCAVHGVRDDDTAATFAQRQCPECGRGLRPDITWFGDHVDSDVFDRAGAWVTHTDWLVAIGTTASVYPADSFLPLAQRSGVRMIEINPEASEMSELFERVLRAPASIALPQVMPLSA